MLYTCVKFHQCFAWPLSPSRNAIELHRFLFFMISGAPKQRKTVLNRNEAHNKDISTATEMIRPKAVTTASKRRSTSTTSTASARDLDLDSAGNLHFKYFCYLCSL